MSGLVSAHLGQSMCQQFSVSPLQYASYLGGQDTMKKTLHDCRRNMVAAVRHGRPQRHESTIARRLR